MFKDHITSTERLNLDYPKLLDYANLECDGCGKTSNELSIEDGWTDEDFDNNSVHSVWGGWYHSYDCLRDTL